MKVVESSYWKRQDYQYLDDFADQLVNEIGKMVRKMPLMEDNE